MVLGFFSVAFAKLPAPINTIHPPVSSTQQVEDHGSGFSWNLILGEMLPKTLEEFQLLFRTDSSNNRFINIKTYMHYSMHDPSYMCTALAQFDSLLGHTQFRKIKFSIVSLTFHVPKMENWCSE